MKFVLNAGVGSLLDDLDLYAVEPDRIARPLVELVQCLGMLVPELWRYPYCYAHAASGGIGKQLAEMDVVGLFQLVLDSDHHASVGVPRQYVEGERAYRHFLLDQLQSDAKLTAEKMEVLGEPRREV